MRWSRDYRKYSRPLSSRNHLNPAPFTEVSVTSSTVTCVTGAIHHLRNAHAPFYDESVLTEIGEDDLTSPR